MKIGDKQPTTTTTVQQTDEPITTKKTSTEKAEAAGEIKDLLLNPALAELKKIIVGQGDVGQRPKQDASGNEALASLFGPLSEKLAEAAAEPGGKFALDGLPGPLAPPFVMFKEMAALIQDAAVDPAVAQEDRVRVVKQYQGLTEQMFLANPGSDARLAEMPGRARVPLMNAILDVAAVMREERVPAEHDIEIPDATVLAEEKKLREVAGKVVAAVGTAAKHGALGAPLAQIDWNNTPIEDLLQLVLMEGYRIESASTRDLLKGMDAQNKKKEQMRKLSSEAKQNKAQLERKQQNEFNEFRASGAISDKVTFDQYKTWREVSFTGMTEDGQLPAPQMKPIGAGDIPEWMRTGDVSKAAGDDLKNTQKAFGLEPTIDAKLRKVFGAVNHGDMSYPQWLQETIGLTTVGGLEDITTNLKVVGEFLRGMDGPAIARAVASPDVGGVNGDLLTNLQNTYTDLAKAELLHATLPDVVTNDVLQGLRRNFEKLAADPDTKAAFDEWKAGPGQEVLAEYRGQVDAFTAQMLSPQAYYGGSDKKRDGNISWDDNTWNDLYNQGAGLPGDIHFVVENGQYVLVKTVEVNMAVPDADRGFLENVKTGAKAVAQGTKHVVQGAASVVTGLFGEDKGGSDDPLPDATWKVDCPFAGNSSSIMVDINRLTKDAMKPPSIGVVDYDDYKSLQPKVTQDGLEFTVGGEVYTVSWDDFAKTVGQDAAMGCGAGMVVGGIIGAVGGGVAGGIAGGILLGAPSFGAGGVPGAICGALLGAYMGACLGLAAGMAVGGAVGGTIGVIHGLSEAKRDKLIDHLHGLAKQGDPIKDEFLRDLPGRYEPKEAPPTPEQIKRAKDEKDRAAVVAAALGGVGQALTSLGSAETEGSEYHKWARRVGLDQAWNASQAAAKQQANTPVPSDKPVDPATGVTLELVGNLAYYDAKMQEIDDTLDSIKSMSELDQMKLQRQMERQAKLLETLSNLTKAMAQTSKTITDNMR